MNKTVDRMEDLSTNSLTDLWILAEERPDVREQARHILQDRITRGTFSLQDVVTFAGHVVNVWFTATSGAFEQYGQYVTGTFIIHPVLPMRILNSDEQTGMAGMVCFNGMDDHLTENVKIQLKDIGFHTNDVLRITY